LLAASLAYAHRHVINSSATVMWLAHEPRAHGWQNRLRANTPLKFQTFNIYIIKTKRLLGLCPYVEGGVAQVLHADISPAKPTSKHDNYEWGLDLHFSHAFATLCCVVGCIIMCCMLPMHACSPAAVYQALDAHHCSCSSAARRCGASAASLCCACTFRNSFCNTIQYKLVLETLGVVVQVFEYVYCYRIAVSNRRCS
jgi:hypothetical protein